MANRPDNTLVASDAYVYIDGERHKNRITAISESREIQYQDTTTLADKFMTCVPTLDDRMFDFEMNMDGADAIIDQLDGVDKGHVPFVWSQDGDLTIGKRVTVVEVAPKSFSQSTAPGELVKLSYGTGLSGRVSAGTLRTSGTEDNNGKLIWQGAQGFNGEAVQPIVLSAGAEMYLHSAVSLDSALTKTAILLRVINYIPNGNANRVTIEPFKVLSNGTRVSVGEPQEIRNGQNYIWTVDATDIFGGNGIAQSIRFLLTNIDHNPSDASDAKTVTVQFAYIS